MNVDLSVIALLVAIGVPLLTTFLNRFGGKSDRSDDHILELRKAIADLRENQLMQEIRMKDYMGGQYATKADVQAIEVQLKGFENQLKGLRAIVEPVFRRMYPDAAVPE